MMSASKNDSNNILHAQPQPLEEFRPIDPVQKKANETFYQAKVAFSRSQVITGIFFSSVCVWTFVGDFVHPGSGFKTFGFILTTVMAIAILYSAYTLLRLFVHIENKKYSFRKVVNPTLILTFFGLLFGLIGSVLMDLSFVAKIPSYLPPLFFLCTIFLFIGIGCLGVYSNVATRKTLNPNKQKEKVLEGQLSQLKKCLNCIIWSIVGVIFQITGAINLLLVGLNTSYSNAFFVKCFLVVAALGGFIFAMSVFMSHNVFLKNLQEQGEQYNHKNYRIITPIIPSLFTLTSLVVLTIASFFFNSYFQSISFNDLSQMNTITILFSATVVAFLVSIVCYFYSCNKSSSNNYANDSNNDGTIDNKSSVITSELMSTLILQGQ